MRVLVERSLIPGAAYRVVKVLSDQAAAEGLATARGLGVPAEALTPASVAAAAHAGAGHPGTTRSAGIGGAARGAGAAAAGAWLAYDRALASALDACSPALIVLAGFMRILSPEFVAHFGGRVLNIHPSLLPKFPGLHTHRRALEAREAEHGATVHFVTEQLDGGPRIIQARVPVRPDDDEASLARRVQAGEHRIYPLAVEWFCAGRLRFQDGRAWLDGRPLTEPVDLAGIAA
jgi:phosphoribosylglycinamide formyltransferase-1